MAIGAANGLPKSSGSEACLSTTCGLIALHLQFYFGSVFEPEFKNGSRSEANDESKFEQPACVAVLSVLSVKTLTKVAKHCFGLQTKDGRRARAL